MRSLRLHPCALVLPAVVCMVAYAPLASGQKAGQTPPGTGQGAQNPSQPSSGASLQGLSWPRSTWDQDLGLPPNASSDKTAVACYTLIYGNSAVQPLLLKPATRSDELEPFGQTCKTDASGRLTETNPGIMKRCQIAKDLALATDQADLQKLQNDQEKAKDVETKQEQQAAAIKITFPPALKALYQEKMDNLNKQIDAQQKKITTEKPDTGFKGIKWCYCAKLDAEHPIRMGQTLVIGIDANNAAGERVKILNVNLTNQQGSPINPAPLRPSFSNTASTATNLSGGPYYLTWPNQVPGDTIVTVNVNAVYTPPIPGDKWQPATFYPAGSVVTDKAGSGHYYTAKSGGVSSKVATQEPAFGASAIRQVPDGQAVWVDSGNTQPQSSGGQTGAQGASSLWQPGNPYTRGQVIFDPYNGHYYTNLAVTGPACPAPATSTCNNSGLPPTDPFSIPTISDGTVAWGDMGTNPPTGIVASTRTASASYNHGAWVRAPGAGDYYEAVQAGPGTTGSGPFVFPVYAPPQTVTDGDIVWTLSDDFSTAHPAWSAYSPYDVGNQVSGSNGHVYQAKAGGNSGGIPTQPFFGTTMANRTTPEMNDTSAAVPALPIVWEDSGTTAPASVASGQPADQVVSLLNFQLAQSHSLTYYNLASGVVYSMVRSRAFGFTPANCSTSTTATTGGSTPVPCVATQTGTSAVIDPVLLFTIYPKPWDSETHCPHSWCLGHLKSNPPGVSFGLSLASPSSSFYVGGSFEVFRNIQLVGGYNWSKQAHLPPSTTSQPSQATSSGTPLTIQKFSSAPFFGVTLNISGFIQGLFGGGGGGGGGGSANSGGGGKGSVSPSAPPTQ